MAEYRLSPAAEMDLEKIWQYTCEQWGKEQALLYIDHLNTTFETLAKSPLSAPSCNDIRAGYRRCHVEKHTIYYQVTAYGVAIIRVLHERMDSVRHL